MSAHPPGSLDIVIIGAGIGGLTAGIALQQRGHRVRLFDRVAQLTPAGAALSIWPNGVQVMQRLGLADALKAASGEMTAMSYSTPQGEQLTRFSLQPLYASVGQRACPVARTALQQILLDACGEHNVALGVSCESVEPSAGGMRVTLSDGQQLQADLVIAADGTHSRLRNYVSERQVQREYCGYVNWNGRVDIADDLAPANDWAQFVGDNQRVSLMPMGNGQFYFFFDVPLPAGTANRREAYQTELREHFRGWAQPVQRLIDRLDPTSVSRVEIHDMPPLASFVRERVVLLGDAAHPMAPDLGQGGCQAMEDAWVLAECLSTLDVGSALQRYDAERVERTAQIMRRARQRSDVTHGRAPEQTWGWYEELRGESGERVIAGLVKTAVGGGFLVEGARFRA
ncbi:FAD-dependent urate hydroxylase HpxO [Pseudomonas sp. HR96]|uniref:FAD-dependent urate hydroxylase HpxO n=1 Tax=Pseudomonas sp. HR96 TaxID=1027966 RepID=UPI002A761A7E|nr:FAD-dependent urate hydroxylase HpxO [Pseudomonas sp. HR96]WPO97793.1 FAD-dependent urate hydroxylase HpxO [Pseudomonas sp. HR96]